MEHSIIALVAFSAGSILTKLYMTLKKKVQKASGSGDIMPESGKDSGEHKSI